MELNDKELNKKKEIVIKENYKKTKRQVIKEKR